MAFGLQSSRRNFLVGMGRFAAAAEVVRLLPGSAIAAEAAGTGGALCPPPSAWSDLARGVSGGVLRPEDPFFADVCRPNNLRYGATLPAGIARCVTASDVQSCVRWVKDQAMPFAVRSGGHNYAGFSTTPGLLIDMSKMAGAEPVAGKDGLVRVLGGTINSLVYKQMERLGRTITHGRCDTVGAAGFLLGGGIGFNMRKFGMASDLLRATELVTADGNRLTADADRDSALYWACRGGGGGNFGINTSFTLETRPAEPVTVFNLTWTTDLPRVLKLLLTELAAAPDEFGSKISVTIPSWQERCDKVPLSLSVLGQLHTSKATLKDIFASTWELADQRVVKENVPYWQGQDFLTETTFPYYYQEKSSYMTAARITDEAIAAMFDWGGADARHLDAGVLQVLPGRRRHRPRGAHRDRLCPSRLRLAVHHRGQLVAAHRFRAADRAGAGVAAALLRRRQPPHRGGRRLPELPRPVAGRLAKRLLRRESRPAGPGQGGGRPGDALHLRPGDPPGLRSGGRAGGANPTRRTPILRTGNRPR